MAEAERTFLGMTHNPFLEPQGFFERGGRKTHLEQLRHLSHWSRRVLVVTGPEGAGKSALYRQLAATLEPGVKAARINASLVNSDREVLAAIGTGFGLFVTADANTQALRHLILEHVESQSAAGRQCLTLVDDAHFLSNKAVDQLVRLAQESAMHLVLFGEVRLVPVVERSVGHQEVGWQEIRLTGYGDAEARDYLEWRFQQARYRGRVPFTDNQVKELVRLSEGLPGRLNQMANVLLARLEGGEPGAERRGFPRLHAAMLVFLVSVTGLLYVVLSGDSEPDEVTLAVEELRLPDVVETPEPDVPSSLEAAGSVAEPAEPDPPEVPIREEPGSPVGGQPPEAVVASATVVSPETANDGGPVGAGPVTPEGQASPTADMAAAAAGRRDTAWLLAQDPGAFTLQLVTVSSLASATAFVDKQRTPDDFAIYQLKRDRRTLHVVVYGLYPTREAAQSAADRLPAEVGDIQPWIRPLEQVQAAARISLLE